MKLLTGTIFALAFMLYFLKLERISSDYYVHPTGHSAPFKVICSPR